MTTGLPQRAGNRSARSRAPISAPDPGPSGTMNFTDRCGHDSARTGAVEATARANRTIADTRTRGMGDLPRRLEIERLGDLGDLRALAGHDLGKFFGAAARRRLCGRVELGVGVPVVSHRDDVGADLFAQLG